MRKKNWRVDRSAGGDRTSGDSLAPAVGLVGILRGARVSAVEIGGGGAYSAPIAVR